MSQSTDPRSAYIAIAARKFAETGFHGTSLAMLAEEARVTKQALLHFFGTKDRLYAEVLTDLSGRMSAELEAAKSDDPVRHLIDHFSANYTTSERQPDNAKLVIRALLDSNEGARVWPMKPYLDALIVLVQETPGGRHLSHEDALAWIFQLIGGMQYFAISSTAISGMYGKQACKSVSRRYKEGLLNSIEMQCGQAKSAA